jgi:hypothetical protein
MIETEHEIPIDTALLNTLLRNEMTAVEAYTQVMCVFEDEFVIADLQRIRDEHHRSVRELRDHVACLGLALADASMPASGEAFAVTAPTHADSPATALALLRQGEEQGITEYEAAVESDGIHPDCLVVIRTSLLPACRRHVEELDRLLGGMDH